MKRFLIIFNLLCISLFFVFGCKQTTPEEKINKGIEQAKQEQREGNNARALATLEALDLKFPNNPLIIEQLAIISEAMGKAAAADYYEKAFSLNPNAEFLLKAAQLSLKNGNQDRAIGFFEKYLEKNPKNADVWTTLADNYYHKKEYAKSVNAYIAAIKENKNKYNAATAERLGELYYNLKRYDDAKAHLKNAAISQNATYRAQALLIMILANEKDFSELEQMIANYDKRYPQNTAVIAPARAALTEYKAKQSQEQEKAKQAAAIEAAKAAEEKRRTEEAARLAEQTRLAEEKRKADEAAKTDEANRIAAEKQAAKEAEESKFNAIKPYIEDARKAKDAGDLHATSHYLRKAISVDSENATLWYDLSRVLIDQSRWSEAQVAAGEASRLAPENYEYALHFLQTLPETYQFNKVSDEITRVYLRFPEKYQTLYWMAERYRAQDSVPEATYLYREFLRRSPTTFPYRDEARAALSQMTAK